MIVVFVISININIIVIDINSSRSKQASIVHRHKFSPEDSRNEISKKEPSEVEADDSSEKRETG